MGFGLPLTVPGWIPDFDPKEHKEHEPLTQASRNVGL